MSDVLAVDLVSLPYDERLAALLARHVGLWDTVAEAVRPGSLDAAIRDRVDNDLHGLVARLPALRLAAFNGGTSAKIGAQGAGRRAGPAAARPAVEQSGLYAGL